MGWVGNAKPLPIYPHGRRPGAQCIGGSVWTGAENIALTGIPSQDRPARSESLYRVRYSGTTELFYNERTIYRDYKD
jgi:hypothetical protein